MNTIHQLHTSLCATRLTFDLLSLLVTAATDKEDTAMDEEDSSSGGMPLFLIMAMVDIM